MSLKGLGCVLIYHRKVIAYGSRQVNPDEQDYPSHSPELITVIFALKVWCHLMES